MGWLAVTAGVCLLSAVVPVVNAELYLVGLVTQQPQLPWWLVGLAAAVGQLTGKLVFYYAGRGSLRLPARLHRRSGPGRPGRWSDRLARFQVTCQDRPVWTTSVLLLSAAVGLPPFAATSFVAGVARVRLGIFLYTGLVGRFIRFSAIAAAPGLLNVWWLAS
jgi:membrane protein YqaA with SNARE-associated domain